MDQKALLRFIPYFQGLDDATLGVILHYVIVRRFSAGEIIFLEQNPNAGLHLVATGLCKVYRLSEEGREHILTVLKPGDSCNEVPVIDNGPNPANLIAVEDSVVWIISGETMDHLRQQFPQLNDAIIYNLALRCRQLVQRIHNLSFLPVTGRLASFLLQYQNERHQLNRSYWTQDEIAAHLGTVREMVGRAFRELQRANLIATDRHHIEILDEAGLRRLT